jgi:hypothetical protein
MPEPITRGVEGFMAVNGITLTACLIVFYSIHAYLRHRRLL